VLDQVASTSSRRDELAAQAGFLELRRRRLALEQPGALARDLGERLGAFGIGRGHGRSMSRGW
jgi:hypothetical protein